MACYCCVLGCKNNNHKATSKHFFRFPKNDEKRQKLWKRFTRKQNVPATAVICEDHFEHPCFVQKDKKLKLTIDAVPTVFFDKIVSFNGNDYFGDEANEMDKAIETCKRQEIDEIESAFLNEQIKLDDIKSRCRFCAEAKEEIIDISSFATYNVNIDSVLQSLNLHIIESDFFPSSVCEECFKQVLLIDTFIVKCKTADQWLWDEIGKLKTIIPAVASPVKAAETAEDKDLEDEFIVPASESCDYVNEEYQGGDELTEKSQHFATSFEEQEAVDKKSSILETSAEENVDTDDVESSKKSIGVMDPTCNKFAMKTYSCEICSKLFAGLKTFKSHVCDVPEIRCTECGEIFDTVFNLKLHRRHLHNDNNQKHYCPICKTVITGRLTAFKRHKAKCNRNRTENIQCEICQKVCET